MDARRTAIRPETSERPHWERSATWSVARRDWLIASIRRGFVREVALVTFAILAYFAIRNLTAGSTEAAFTNAARIEDLERWLGVAQESSVQAAIVGNDSLVALANWVYIWGHWPVLLSTAVALYFLRRDRYYVLRNAIIVSGAIGFFFFALFPVAPPRLVDAALVDTVTEQSHAYRAFQPPGLTNQYAAFPSLHLGWNLVVGVVLLTATASLAIRVFAVISPVAMAFAVVATANHYIVDVAAGVVVVLVGLVVAHSIELRQATATLDDRAPRPDDCRRGAAKTVPGRPSCRKPHLGPPRRGAARVGARRG